MVQLGKANRRILEEAHGRCSGPAPWRYRKLAELHDVLALAELSQRIVIERIDLQETFFCQVFLHVPIPLRPETSGRLQTADGARLAIVYPEEALRRPMPGFAFITILDPLNVWHANVAPDGIQALCLGPSLPAGIRIRDLVLMAYEAICLQSVMIDETDPAGLLNFDAAVWWQQNLTLAPLTKKAFLDPIDGTGPQGG